MHGKNCTLASFFLLSTWAWLSIAIPAASASTVCQDGSCDYTTIGEALQNAVSGEVILIQAGVYREFGLSAPYGVRGITLKGDGRDSTIIDAEGKGKALRLDGGGLMDITIQNGVPGVQAYTTPDFPNLSIRNCLIRNNVHPAGRGGGLWIGGAGGQVEIVDCEISDNRASESGGGVAVMGNNNGVLIQNTRILNNQAVWGGGLYVDGSNLTIRGSMITGNQSVAASIQSAYGGGIYLDNVDWGLGNKYVIDSTTISGNTATGGGANNTKGAGGGLYVHGNAPLTLTNSTVTGNTADYDTTVGGGAQGLGGGIYVMNTNDDNPPVVLGATITGNVASTGGGGVYCHPRTRQRDTSFSGVLAGNSPDETQGCGLVTPGTTTAKSQGNLPQSGTSNDPVNTFTGELFSIFPPDLNLGGPLPLSFRRYYASMLIRDGNIRSALGDNWLHNFDMALTRVGDTVTVITNRGRVITFQLNGSQWELTGKTDTPYQLAESGTDLILADPGTGLLYTFDNTGRLSRIEDGRGNAHVLTYNTEGALSQVSDGLGRILTFTYDADGRLGTVSDGLRSITFEHTGNDLTQVTDARGNVTTFTYTSGSLLTATTRPEGNTPYTQTYDSENRVADQSDSGGNTFRFDYAGTKTTLSGPDDTTRIHEHTGTGEFLSRTDQAGESFTMGYDQAGRRNSLTDRLGNTTTLDFDNASGQLTRLDTADGGRLTFGYTGRTSGPFNLRDLTSVGYPDGTTEAFTRDALGNAIEYTDQAGFTRTATYNGNGQPLTVTNPRGGTTTYTYNADGTRASMEDPAGNQTLFGYDGFRRLNQITHPDESVSRFYYDEANNLIETQDENDNTTFFDYDKNGNLAAITDSLDNVTRFAYDGNDRLTRVTDPLGADATLAYDAFGHVATFTDRNGNTVDFQYDARGRMTALIDGLDNTWAREYDSEGVIAARTDPLGNRIAFQSDPMGRITRISSPLGHSIDIAYDPMGRVTRITDPLGEDTDYAYEPRGLVASVTRPGGIQARYAYDDLGNLTEVTDPAGNVWVRRYDNQGRQTAKADPLGNEESYSHDNRNRLARVTYPGSLGTQDLTYDPAGNLTRRAYSDGTTIDYSYDTNNRLIAANGVSLAYDANGELIDSNSIAIARDAGGRIERITLAPGKVLTYAYDANDRLVRVTDWLGGTTEFTYDKAGRRTAVSRPNGIDSTLGYDVDGRLVSLADGTLSDIRLTRDARGQVTAADRSVPLAPGADGLGTDDFSVDAAGRLTDGTYDAAGRLLARAGETYAWNLASRLVTFTVNGTTVSATYDAFGMRLTRAQGGNTRSYIWNHALGLPSIAIERDGSGDRYYYVHTPAGELLYRIDAATGARQFYHYDEMGNTLFVTDDSGAVLATYAYTPFGRLIDATGGLDNPFTWRGRTGVMAEGSDLYYMRERYYDAATGRFISPDPVPGFSPERINPYQYALNNPLLYDDPLGAQSHAADTDLSALSDRELRERISGLQRRLKTINRRIESLRDIRSTFAVFSEWTRLAPETSPLEVLGVGIFGSAANEVVASREVDEILDEKLNVESQLALLQRQVSRREATRLHMRQKEVQRAYEEFESARRVFWRAQRQYLRSRSPEAMGKWRATHKRFLEAKDRYYKARKRPNDLQDASGRCSSGPDSIIPELSGIVIYC